MVLLLAGCHPRIVPSSSGDILSTGSEIGYASYYADRFNGLTTANGEIYQSSRLTAAHKTLPFGAVVTVTNLSNQKSVKVRINDRGPFVTGRVIDLSKAAAKKLDMINDGVVKVRIRYVE
ncbi:MAG: hypothetical protein NVSMB63_05390 [Sediminibacterium sp.]